MMERRWNVQSIKSLQGPKTVTFPSNEWPWRTIPSVYDDPKDFQLPVPTLQPQRTKRHSPVSTRPAIFGKWISDFLWKVSPNRNSSIIERWRWKVWNPKGQLRWGFLIPCVQLLPQLHSHQYLGTTLSLESRLGQILPSVQTFRLLIGKISPNLFVCSWRENIP